MACPLTLPREIARRFAAPVRRFPRALRNKWIGIALLVGMLFAYEAWDLWSSPAWTAGLIVGYFALALIIDAVFERASFCKYRKSEEASMDEDESFRFTARMRRRCQTKETAGNSCIPKFVVSLEELKTLDEDQDESLQRICYVCSTLQLWNMGTNADDDEHNKHISSQATPTNTSRLLAKENQQ
jgi:hypothetical protein